METFHVSPVLLMEAKLSMSHELNAFSTVRVGSEWGGDLSSLTSSPNQLLLV